MFVTPDMKIGGGLGSVRCVCSSMGISSASELNLLLVSTASPSQ